MNRTIGTVIRGVRCPLIKAGDNLAEIVVNSVFKASKEEKISFRDKDIVAITESVLARSQGNYVTTKDIASDIKSKFPDGEIGLLFPILSRNRFANCLKGIALGAKKIYLQLAYPRDEVGNSLITSDKLEASNINPYSDILTLDQYRQLFGENKHPFTGIDYVKYYEDIIKEAGCQPVIIFANRLDALLTYTKNILTCDIHTRFRNKKKLNELGAKIVYGLDDILNEPINNSGYNSDYGLLGSNKADANTLKLFPRDCNNFVNSVASLFKEKTGKNIEVMVYGDGAFKDPRGGIWELADPVVSPAFTSNLAGRPNELKLKYLADNDYKDLRGSSLEKAIKERIKQKNNNLVGEMVSEGTTPRQIADLVGSLCDLTSGSGDKGTPIVWIQGYFDNYSND